MDFPEMLNNDSTSGIDLLSTSEPAESQITSAFGSATSLIVALYCFDYTGGRRLSQEDCLLWLIDRRLKL